MRKISLIWSVLVSLILWAIIGYLLSGIIYWQSFGLGVLAMFSALVIFAAIGEVEPVK